MNSGIATGATPAGQRASSRLAFWWLAYVAFVVYGSLVPFDFRSLPLDLAWARFRQIPMLQLGIEQRADWIANGVLYLPVGFLSVMLLGGGQAGRRRPFSVIGALLFGCALAVGVEFAQLFFPPRTVSRNDIIAEWIGSALGIVIVMGWGSWFRGALAALSGRLAGRLASHALQAYTAFYLAFSFFPFDVVLSAGELAAKLDSPAWGWLVAGYSLERGAVVLAAKLLAETLAVVPVGMLLASWKESKGLPATRRAALAGGLLGLFIEVVQLFIFSATSQGISLLTRAAGVAAGAALWRQRGGLGRLREFGLRGGALAALVLVYAVGLLAVNGWFDHAWKGFGAAARSLGSTRFVPFYYHYFTTEQTALVSLVSVALMYAPIGALAWLRRWPAAVAGWLAAAAAFGMEAGKLFLAELHADPTNVLIAAFAGWAAARLLERATGNPGIAEVPTMRAVTGSARAAGQGGTRLAAATVLGLAAWVAADFPVASLALAAGLLTYAALLWHRPHFMWFAIPAALPLLDLAPWSGRYYLDEFDYLIMVSLAMGFARTQAVPRGAGGDRLSKAVGVLLGLTFAIGTVRGLLPWQWPDANSFGNYYSPYNALRLAKGALWAFLLLALMRRFAGGVGRLFAAGMVVGLAGTVAVVVWERIAFPGLLNFDDVYRVTGPFSAMHVGGADLEAFLTMAIPFAMLMLAEARMPWLRAGIAVLMLGATYALMVTFSRAGYAGFALALGISALFALRLRWRQGTWRWLAPAAAIVAALAVAAPIFLGTFAQERLARSAEDLKARAAHWRDALAMRDPDLMTSVFGMGLGRFPETHYWRSGERRVGGYRLVREGDNAFLRLGGGLPLYLEQPVATKPGEDYRLSFSIRASDPGTGITFSLCEKWLLTSAQCVFASASVDQPGAAWEQREITLASGTVGAGGALRRTVKLSFYNPAATGVVDIDNVRLIAADGRALLANGDFRSGMDRWFFSADQDLPWHIWSMPVALMFELGWFGLLAVGGAVLLALARSATSAWKGDNLADSLLAALVGLIALAGVDTLIDAPRVLMLVMFLLLATRSRSANRPRWA